MVYIVLGEIRDVLTHERVKYYSNFLFYVEGTDTLNAEANAREKAKTKPQVGSKRYVHITSIEELSSAQIIKLLEQR